MNVNVYAINATSEEGRRSRDRMFRKIKIRSYSYQPILTYVLSLNFAQIEMILANVGYPFWVLGIIASKTLNCLVFPHVDCIW